MDKASKRIVSRIEEIQEAQGEKRNKLHNYKALYIYHNLYQLALLKMYLIVNVNDKKFKC